jgi:hypothetical protein
VKTSVFSSLLVWPTRLVLAALLVLGTSSWCAQTKPTEGSAPNDSPVFDSFRQLEMLPGYRMVFTLVPRDPRLAKMMSEGMGFVPMEETVQRSARQVTMHMKIPAMDQPGTIDDWEIRAVVKDAVAHASSLPLLFGVVCGLATRC